MSTECNKCGSDLTYPADTYPIGSCRGCELEQELESLRDAARNLAGVIDAFTAVGGLRLVPSQIEPELAAVRALVEEQT